MRKTNNNNYIMNEFIIRKKIHKEESSVKDSDKKEIKSK